MKAKAVKTLTDNSGKTIGYVLKGFDGSVVQMKSEDIKKKIRNKQLNVINLEVTVDNKLIHVYKYDALTLPGEYPKDLLNNVFNDWEFRCQHYRQGQLLLTIGKRYNNENAWTFKVEPRDSCFWFIYTDDYNYEKEYGKVTLVIDASSKAVFTKLEEFTKKLSTLVSTEKAKRERYRREFDAQAKAEQARKAGLAQRKENLRKHGFDVSDKSISLWKDCSEYLHTNLASLEDDYRNGCSEDSEKAFHSIERYKSLQKQLNRYTSAQIGQMANNYEYLNRFRDKIDLGGGVKSEAAKPVPSGKTEKDYPTDGQGHIFETGARTRREYLSGLYSLVNNGIHAWNSMEYWWSLSAQEREAEYHDPNSPWYHYDG